MRTAGAEQADILMTLTEGDNRNALAAQLGKHTFGIPRVIAKINDPLRGEAYRALGLETICRTIILGRRARHRRRGGRGGHERVRGGADGPAAARRATARIAGRRARRRPPSSRAPTRSAEATIVQPGEGREGGF